MTHLAAVTCVCYSRVGQFDTDGVKSPQKNSVWVQTVVVQSIAMETLQGTE